MDSLNDHTLVSKNCEYIPWNDEQDIARTEWVKKSQNQKIMLLFGIENFFSDILNCVRKLEGGYCIDFSQAAVNVLLSNA